MLVVCVRKCEVENGVTYRVKEEIDKEIVMTLQTEDNFQGEQRQKVD